MHFRLLLVGMCAFPTFACDLFTQSYGDEPRSDLAPPSYGVCISMLDSYNYASETVISIQEKEKSFETESYWESWAFRLDSDPLLSQSLSSNHFGVGVWMPSDLLEESKTMSTEDWIRSHGLQFSVGFGDRKPGEPRMRFDYRWHEKYEGDVMMQIEVPF
nr:hypothetical protein [Vibrio mexicanus]